VKYGQTILSDYYARCVPNFFKKTLGFRLYYKNAGKKEKGARLPTFKRVGVLIQVKQNRQFKTKTCTIK
jgi:hypothetical protein